MLVGRGLVLRKHSPDDAARMFACVDRDRARLSKYLPWVPTMRTLQDEVEYVRHTHLMWKELKEFDYSIVTDAGHYVGNIGAHTVHWESERCEIGYWIAAGFEGRGLLSSALRALEKALFESGFRRIEIRCLAENTRSVAVAERNSYVLEGTLRARTKMGDRYLDELIFAKLRT